MAQPQRYASAAQRQAAYRHRLAQARAVQLAAQGSAPTPTALAREAHWRMLLQQAHHALEQLLTELQECYDARSATWQESARGETFQERIDAVQELLDNCLECASSSTPQPPLAIRKEHRGK